MREWGFVEKVLLTFSRFTDVFGKGLKGSGVDESVRDFIKRRSNVLKVIILRVINPILMK